MGNFSNTAATIETLYQERQRGIWHYIPLPERLGSLAKAIPGIVKADSLLITGSTGSG